MNAQELAREFVRIFAADGAAFPSEAVNLRAEQNAEEMPDEASGPQQIRPHTFVFDVSATPIDAGGTVLRYALNLAVETDPDKIAAPADAAAAHSAWVRKVRIKFFGERPQDLAAARDNIEAAMLAGEKFSLRGYDAGNDALDPAVENSLFRTVFPVRGLAVVAGPV